MADLLQRPGHSSSRGPDQPSGRRSAKSLERSRRRFARRQWRRRVVAWRKIAALVVVAALVAGGVWAVWFSSWLAVEKVQVRGTHSVSDAAVRERSGITAGTPLASLDTGLTAKRVESLTQVRSVVVTRHWPHTVVVTVRERTPVAVVDIGGRLRALDETGAVFGGYQQAPAGLPRVETEVGITTAALREAAEVASALPSSLSPLVDHVSVQGVDQIQLALADDRTAAWGSSASSATKAEVLLGLLRAVPGKSYDVSVPSKPTFR